MSLLGDLSNDLNMTFAILGVLALVLFLLNVLSRIVLKQTLLVVCIRLAAFLGGYSVVITQQTPVRATTASARELMAGSTSSVKAEDVDSLSPISSLDPASRSGRTNLKALARSDGEKKSVDVRSAEDQAGHGSGHALGPGDLQSIEPLREDPEWRA